MNDMVFSKLPEVSGWVPILYIITASLVLWLILFVAKWWPWKLPDEYWLPMKPDGEEDPKALPSDQPNADQTGRKLEI